MTYNVAPAAHVVVIDDDADMRDVVQIILEDAGYAVTVAPDGDAALAVLQQAARLPDLILLDLGMPILDGRAFRHAQQADRQWRTIPVIAVSAEREVHAVAAALGMAAVLPKPFTVPALLRTVQRYAR